MAMQKVYHFTVFDIQRGENVVAKSKATREFINKAKGKLIEDTEQEADESQLTPEGQWKVSQERLRP